MEQKEKLPDLEEMEKQIRSDEMAACKFKSIMWTKALMSGNKKVKLKEFSDPVQEKLYLFERIKTGEATTGEIMRLSILTGVTSSVEYEDYLEIERNCEEDDT